MTGTTHRFGGILAGVVLMEYLQIKDVEAVELLTGSVLGSILPDIDKLNTGISNQMPIIATIINMGQRMVRVLSMFFPKKLRRMLRTMAGHRGIFHSLLFPGALWVGLMTYGNGRWHVLLLGCVIGILSHLLLDMFSGGVPLFLPVCFRRIKLAGVDTGGFLEKSVRVAIVILILYVWRY